MGGPSLDPKPVVVGPKTTPHQGAQPPSVTGTPTLGAPLPGSNAARVARVARSSAFADPVLAAGSLGLGVLNPALGVAVFGVIPVVDLKGRPYLDHNAILSAAITVIGPQKLDVHFGDLARGTLVITENDDGYQAKPSMLDMTHPHLQSREPRRRVTMVLEVVNSEVSGYIATHDEPGSFRPVGQRLVLYEEQLLPILFGRAYHGRDSVELSAWVNQVRGGQLTLATGFRLTPPDGPPIFGNLAVIDESASFEAKSMVEGLGLAPTIVEVTRSPDGLLVARHPIELSQEWTGHGFDGSVAMSFVDGSFEARGDLNFAYPDKKAPRVRGQVSVVVTTVEKAWAAARANDPAPLLTGGVQPSRPGSGFALAGWGTLEVEITKKLVGDAAFLVDPDGYVTARGTIRMPGTITLFDQYDVPLGDLLGFAKRHWEWSLAEEPIFIAVKAEAHIEVDLSPSARLGPVTLRDVVISGLYSTRPGTGSLLSIAASLNVSGEAALTASAALVGGFEFGFTIPFTDWKVRGRLSLNTGVSGTGRVKGYADLRPTIIRKDPGAAAGGEPEYRIKGRLEVAGEVTVGLQWGGGLDFLGFWKPGFGVNVAEYPIAGGGIAADLDYAIGSDPHPKVTFSRPKFNPRAFVKALRPGGGAPTVHDPLHGSYRDAPTGKKTAVTGTPPPAPPGPPPPGVELEVPFEVRRHKHHLWLAMGPPPHVDVATVRALLSTRLQVAQERVSWARTWETDASRMTLLDQQVQDLTRIILATRKVEADAAKLGVDTRELFAAELPGLAELAEELAEYGQRYEDWELDGSTRVGTAGIGQPEVGTETEVTPGTTAPAIDAEVAEFFVNHGFTYDPATGVATKVDADGTVRTAKRDLYDHWVLYLDGVELAREHATPLYKNSPKGAESFFQAHHPVQDAWALDRLAKLAAPVLRDPKVKYRSGDEPSILLRDSYAGSPHQRVTARQKGRESSIPTRDYKAERAEVDRDLDIADVPSASQTDVLAKADTYFKTLHDNIKDAAVRTGIFADFFPG